MFSQVPCDTTIPAEVPQELQITAQELPTDQQMPEEPSTVRPQEEPEIQLVSHVQEISSPKRLILYTGNNFSTQGLI